MNELRNGYGGVASTRTGGLAIDAGLRQYMLGVYNYMGLAVAATGLLSFFVASQPALLSVIAGGPLKWVLFAALLGIGFFAPKVIFSGSRIAAHGMFWIYAALWGLMIAPMLAAFQMAGAAQEIYKAFFITAAMFASTSLFGYTTKRDLSGMASFLFMASIGLLIAMVVNLLIFKSAMGSLIISSLVVLVFAAVTAFETQMVKNLYVEGGASNDRASIFGAFALYGSFVTLFVNILNILGIMRSNE
ncbi:MAG: Bax inhibitor-1/YccA family protein [Parvularculaceae bacterium]|nr:Bax inhibitor-1/YccA family protein [Parvularculaceae bacterium]